MKAITVPLFKQHLPAPGSIFKARSIESKMEKKEKFKDRMCTAFTNALKVEKGMLEARPIDELLSELCSTP